MYKTAVGYAIGKFLQVMGGVLLVPMIIATYDHGALPISHIAINTEVLGFSIAVLFSFLLGSFFVIVFKDGRHEQGIKEGYAIVTFGWLAMTFVTAIPFCGYLISIDPHGWSNFFLHFTDSYFEMMSGFTTTGATILSNIETVPRSILFLRALTHWLGGMGIITLAIVIFPTMGVSGYQMFRGEVPGPSAEKMAPRLAQTASVLWGVYMLFTLVETVLLSLGGMSVFEAVCHAFATMATGGFSTENASVAGYGSAYIEWVIIVFMYFAGINFLLHFRALRGEPMVMFKNKEFIFYNGVILVALIIITSVLVIYGMDPIEKTFTHFRNQPMSPEAFAEHYQVQGGFLNSIHDTVRTVLFQVVSIVTTTGFATQDFDLWPDILRFIMVLLMFFGGCAGSTGGGIKMIRVLMIWKVAKNELRKLTQPRLVSPVKIDGHVIDDRRTINVVSFVILFVGLFILTAGLMTLFVPDLTTAVTTSIATIGNIGPGLSGVGAVENYGWIPIPGKWVLVFSMLLGRLEIFTVLIMFRPQVWRK